MQNELSLALALWCFSCLAAQEQLSHQLPPLLQPVTFFKDVSGRLDTKIDTFEKISKSLPADVVETDCNVNLRHFYGNLLVDIVPAVAREHHDARSETKSGKG